MSNGKPPLLFYDGKIVRAKAGFSPRLCAYAEGCGPDSDVDEWWPVHMAIENGDDFSRTLPMDFVLPVLQLAQRQVVVLASPDATEIFSDIEWGERGAGLH